MSLMLPRVSRFGSAAAVTALLTALLSIVEIGGLAPAAHAADTDPVFQSTSGGTRVTVGGVVRSELTAYSSLRVTQPDRSTENATADVDVLNGLIMVGAVSSKQSTSRVIGGTMITSQAKIAGVSLLGGAITVDAIETKATATLKGTEVSRSGGTTFVGLHVQDNKIPINVPRNLTVNIPGLAKVVLNEVTGQLGGDAMIKSIATSIKVTLLQSFNGLNAGATIEITPTIARILIPTPIDGQAAFGAAYSTRAQIKVSDALKLASAPTSMIIAPAGGTNGVDLTNAIAKVNLPGIASVNGLANTANATVTPTRTGSTMTSTIADINLLGGLIRADAVLARARVVSQAGSEPVTTAHSRLVNLVIGGRPIPLSVAPNTVIEIPGLVRVTINEQIPGNVVQRGVTVRALHVVALPDAPNDILGLDLEVGVATTWVLGVHS